MRENFSGVHWMLATPFFDNENLDLKSMSTLATKAEEFGCTGIVALGVTGEVAKLTDNERTQISETVISSAKNIPITLGTSGGSSFTVINRSIEAQKLGAAAVMVSAPPMLKPNDDALLTFYEKLGNSIDIPIVVQDYPETTGVHMSLSFIENLVEKVPSALYLKLEDPPTPNKISSIRQRIGDRMEIFGGLGGVYLLDELARGSAGAMTGFAYPEILISVCELMNNSSRDEAEAIFYKYLPLILFEGQSGIGISIRKAALHLRGFISSPKVRFPGANIDPNTQSELESLITKLNL